MFGSGSDNGGGGDCGGGCSGGGGCVDGGCGCGVASSQPALRAQSH